MTASRSEVESDCHHNTVRGHLVHVGDSGGDVGFV